MRLDEILTKDLILDSIGQEAIFTKYLYFPDLSKRYKNPFRTDVTAGCTFYYSKKDVLYFVDNAWDKKHYDCFAVVMEHYNCSFAKALHHIYNDFSNDTEIEITRRDVDTKKRDVQHTLGIKRRDYRAAELDFWKIEGMNITQELMESRGIFAVQTMWEYDYVVDDCYMTFAFIEDGIITQIYKPLNKGTNKRRFINRSGFILGDYNTLPFISDFAVITKARKCSFYANLLEIPTCYVVNEHIIMTPDEISYMKTNYKNVFTLFDNDRTGMHLAWMYRKLYGIKPLFVPQGKDLTEYLKIVGVQKFNEIKEKLKKQLL